MLTRIGCTAGVAEYMARSAGMDYLKEIAFLDDSDVDNLDKHVNCPGGTTTTGTGADVVVTHNIGFTLSIRTEASLKLCVFYLEHQMRVTHTPNVSRIDLELVSGSRDQRKWEENFKKTKAEPVINCKEWHMKMDNIREFLASVIGDTGVTMADVIHVDSVVPSGAESPADNYLMVDREIAYHAPYTGTAFRNDKRTVWDCMVNICHV
jgi:hypothetical protein